MTAHVLIRYRVEADRLPEHLALLDAVFAELAAVRPEGVRWSSFRLPDGRSFVDLVAVDAPGRLSRLASWGPYRGTLEERCDDPPELVDLQPAGAYPHA